jgi:hypothetical protein
MRTKTLALSTLLGALGSASSLVAQVNVYSINAVGYINATFPPGYSIFTCPLVCSPDNTLASIFPVNTGGFVQGSGHASPLYNVGVTPFSGGHFGAGDGVSYSGGWNNGGTITVNPGQAIFFFNPNPLGGANMAETIVGTVPQNGAYNMTNTLTPGYNLVGSIVPVTGSFASPIINLTNGIGAGDLVEYFDPTVTSGHQTGYTGGITQASYSLGWFPSGAQNATPPTSTSVVQGFFYYNSTPADVASQSPGNPQSVIGQVSVSNEFWVENFTINP